MCCKMSLQLAPLFDGQTATATEPGRRRPCSHSEVESRPGRSRSSLRPPGILSTLSSESRRPGASDPRMPPMCSPMSSARPGRPRSHGLTAATGEPDSEPGLGPVTVPRSCSSCRAHRHHWAPGRATALPGQNLNSAADTVTSGSGSGPARPTRPQAFKIVTAQLEFALYIGFGDAGRGRPVRPCELRRAGPGEGEGEGDQGFGHA